jgi:proline dehydrogenase
VLRGAILRIAHARWFRSLATETRPGRAVAARFVAGETLVEALATARALTEEGLLTMLNHLGENVETPEQALAAREAYLAEIAALADDPAMDPIVSLKLTQLGLDESVKACWANVEPILADAAAADLQVMIDMERHEVVDATLELLALAHERLPGTGIAIQAYLRRSPDDVFALPTGCRVRLVKGAYLEPHDVVLGSKAEVDRAFRRLFTTLIARGHPVDVASHDRDLLDGIAGRIGEVEGGWSRVEFQMLYGVRRDLQRRYAAQGIPVRVYIPYGTEWYPYLTRRLAERPANLWFFASSVVRPG